MTTVKILGTGCKKCRTLEAKVKELIDQNDIDASVEKVTDINEMMNYNIMMTPGLVVNEKVVNAGTVPKDDQILKWIRRE